ncbi:MAG: cation acetate symporter, partial [Micromonosporaceae bacterium]
MNPTYGVFVVALVAVATVGIGAFGLRVSRTTSDFYVASRTISPWWNASAIGGEYLSAASFLGIAGLILAFGADMLWYPVGWTAGYLVLLLLVAAPLRRSGAYTLPDFAEARLESMAARRAASVLVVLIGWLYLMPQFQGAGLTLRTVTGAPAWAGGLVVAAVVLVSVLSGGMRSITFVQTFQYWLKLTALAIPVIFLLLVWRGDGSPSPTTSELTEFREATSVTMSTSAKLAAPEQVTVTVSGVVDGVSYQDEEVSLSPGQHEVRSGSTLEFPAGAAVPVAEHLEPLTTDDWATPLGGGEAHPLYATYSLILATFLGTMGLPHVLVRFYTNPDGRAARRTTLAVLVLLGAFYLFPAVYGALGRLYAPDLLVTGRTDAVVLELPGRMIGGALGDALGALLTAGAFAAFLSTSSGLCVSVAGVLSQDIMARWVHGVRAFRLATALAVSVPFGLAIAGQRLSIANAVGLAFAVAASTFCPLLLLGIWWRRLTDVGAVAGLVAGGALSGGAVLLTILGVTSDGWLGGWLDALLAQPAAWTVPMAFVVMIAVSLASSRRMAPNVARTMVRLHTPE